MNSPTCPSCLKPLVLRVLYSCDFEADLCLPCRLCGHYVRDGELEAAGVPARLVSRLGPWGIDCRELLGYCCGRVGAALPDEAYARRWRQVERDTTRLCEGLRVHVPGLTAEARDFFAEAVDWDDSQVIAWRLEVLRIKLVSTLAACLCQLAGFDPERLPEIPVSLSARERSVFEGAWRSNSELGSVLFRNAPPNNDDVEDEAALIVSAFHAGGVDALRRAAVKVLR